MLRSIVSGVRSFGRKARTVFETTGTERTADPLEAHYDALENHYLNHGIYEDLRAAADEAPKDLIPLRSLRNPAHRVVEFYASKLEPGRWLDEIEFGEDANADALTDAIKRFWKWSNWEAEGRVATRQYAWAGDLFLKVSTKEDSAGAIRAVFIERLDPRHVRDFDKDERGFFTYLKVQTPKERRLEGDDGEFEDYTRTEIWDKERGDYRVFEHTTEDFGERDLAEPPTRLTAEPLIGDDGERLDAGYDFVPVVHVKLRDVGRERGLSAFGHALGGMRECDRLATKLHEMLFPENVWVLARNGMGPDGNPLPPINLQVDADANDGPPDGKGWARGYGRSGYSPDNTIRLGRDKVARLPTGGTLEPKIPNRDMGAPAAALAEQVKEVERELPETAYSRLRELELSGRAIRYMMADVYDRYNEAHQNLAAGMVRLHKMALTIGQAVGLPGFEVEVIGEYGEDGAAFEHTFESPDPFPRSRADELEEMGLEALALAGFKDLGPEPYRRALVDAGWSEADAKKEVDRVAEESELPQMQMPTFRAAGGLGTGTLEDVEPTRTGGG